MYEIGEQARDGREMWMTIGEKDRSGCERVSTGPLWRELQAETVKSGTGTREDMAGVMLRERMRWWDAQSICRIK